MSNQSTLYLPNWTKLAALRPGDVVVLEGIEATVVFSQGVDLSAHTVVLDDDRRLTSHPKDQVEVVR